MNYFDTTSADEPDGFELLGQFELEEVWLEAEDDCVLEHSELDRRLRNLAWPAPPPGARERCLEAILSAKPVGCPPAPPVHPEQPGTGRRAAVSDRVERYQLTRRQTQSVAAARTLRAPRREPRFAAVL